VNGESFNEPGLSAAGNDYARTCFRKTVALLQLGRILKGC
jgi:hypothetical protein